MATPIWNGDADDNAWATPANYVADTAPIDNDSVIIPMMAADSTNDIDGGDITATELNGFDIEDGCGIDIGSAVTALKLDINNGKTLGLGGTGTQYIELTNEGATGLTAVNVTEAGRGSASNYSKNLKGAAVVATLNVRMDPTDTLSVAANASETAAYTTINVYEGTVHIGSGVTCSTLNVYGGTVYNKASIATVLQDGGTLYLQGATACSTSLTVRGGTCYEQSTGTKAAVYIADDGAIDATKCPGATWTNTDMYGTQCKLRDPNKKLTPTNPITLNYAKLAQIDRGEHMNVALTAAS